MPSESKKPAANLPKCPVCRSNKSVLARKGDATYQCLGCSAWFDSDPDEGGDYSDRNPAARLEREERRRR